MLCFRIGDHLVLCVSPLSLPSPLGRGPGVSSGWLVNRGFSPLLFDCLYMACFSVVLIVCLNRRPPTLDELSISLFHTLSCLVPCCCWCFVSLSFVFFWRATVCFVLLVAGVAVCFAPVLWWGCVGGCLFFRSTAC